MQIELITTKKKLTKAILDQLEYATLGDLNYVSTTTGDILGYINLPKERVFLIRSVTGYKKVRDIGWKVSMLGKAELYGTVARSVATTSRSFDTIEARDDYLKMYKEIKRIAMLTHIII